MEDLEEDIKWIFSAEVLEHLTPSREKGISAETERRYRREGARFISNASNTLKLRGDTLATGTVFFHRFFMVQNFTDFNRFVVAAACVLLAGKVEETPKQCKDIVRVAKQVLTEQAKVHVHVFGPNAREELISLERVLLQTIRFDLQVDHPYSYLLKFAKHMKGEKHKIESVLQMAWTFINDSLCTALCLQWEPPVIAVALLYLAGKLSKFDLQSAFQPKKGSWWRQFVLTVDIHDLDSICHQVLDVYSEEEKEQEKAKAAKSNQSEQEKARTSSQKKTDSEASSLPPVVTPQRTFQTPVTPHTMGGTNFVMGVTPPQPPNIMSSTNTIYPPPPPSIIMQQHSSPMGANTNNPMLYHQSLLGQPPLVPPPPSLPHPLPPAVGFNRSPSTGHVQHHPHHMSGHLSYMTSHPPPHMPPPPHTGLTPQGVPSLPPNSSSTHPSHNYPSSWR